MSVVLGSATVAIVVALVVQPTTRARRRALGLRAALPPVATPSQSVRAAVMARIEGIDLMGGRQRRHTRALAGALEDMARSLRAGASLSQALGEVADVSGDPVERDLGAVVARVRAGDTVSSALSWWRDDRDDPGVVLAVAALELASDVGGSRARAVDQVAATLRERSALSDELRAQSSQARLSAVVLIAAPVAFAALAATTDPRVLAFLFTEPAGWACVAVGLVLDAGGALWMERVTRSPW